MQRAIARFFKSSPWPRTRPATSMKRRVVHMILITPAQRQHDGAGGRRTPGFQNVAQHQAALFNNPRGLAISAAGNLYVSDTKQFHSQKSQRARSHYIRDRVLLRLLCGAHWPLTSKAICTSTDPGSNTRSAGFDLAGRVPDTRRVGELRLERWRRSPGQFFRTDRRGGGWQRRMSFRTPTMTRSARRLHHARRHGARPVNH